MTKRKYTSTSIYEDDLVSLDEYVKAHNLKRRADGVAAIIKFAKSHGEM